jgi:hypothetical protein
MSSGYLIAQWPGPIDGLVCSVEESDADLFWVCWIITFLEWLAKGFVWSAPLISTGRNGYAFNMKHSEVSHFYGIFSFPL